MVFCMENTTRKSTKYKNVPLGESSQLPDRLWY